MIEQSVEEIDPTQFCTICGGPALKLRHSFLLECERNEKHFANQWDHEWYSFTDKSNDSI